MQNKSFQTAEDQMYRGDLKQLESITSKMKNEMKAAWDASNPNSKNLNEKLEHGFWILKDDKTKKLSKIDFPMKGAENNKMIPGPKPVIPEKSVIAWFHTHQNSSNDIDPKWKTPYITYPSKDDKNFSEMNGIPGIVKTHSGVYYFGPENK
ncbi:hypothetical protein [Leptospira noguchii]|uniref:hypothetical protein n=1 Tax=Leptospira noguchii TaxID=28182 RepID=UPI00055AB148|nr:hypothetical protein [Leptospira noguchii]